MLWVAVLGVAVLMLPAMTAAGGEGLAPEAEGPTATMPPGAAAVEPDAADRGARIERQLSAMGTRLVVEVVAVDRPAGLAAAEAAVRAVEEVEARLSTWREDSELALLNAAPVDRPFVLSAELAADLERATACWSDTGGAFDPGVGPLVAAWGLRAAGRQPGEDELSAALAASGLRHLELRRGANGAAGSSAGGPLAVRRHPGLCLEEGGFGKGAGLAAAAAVLAADPNVLHATLDLGGQLVRVAGGAAAAGIAGGAESWDVAVADPRDRRQPLLELRLDGGSVATSGNSERGIVVDGRRLGHLLDPADGRPVADFGSLTVWTADPLWADCLSTGLYVLGPDRALAWAAARPGVEVLVVEAQQPEAAHPVSGAALRLRATPGLAGRAHPLAGMPVEVEAVVTGAARSVVSETPAGVGRQPRKSRAGAVTPGKGRLSARSATAPATDALCARCEDGSKEEYR